ncbi:nuclear transport factor 2 family protein [Pedobacter sp.]|uniref:nuclear transport factor 2 family protein n=1 Tax=Pedobacter sp. TaxID=1411316 RepID=UPI003BAD5DB1
MDTTTNTMLAERLFRLHLEKFTNPDMTVEAYADLFTEDAVQQYPYAPAPYAKEVVGRHTIAEYIANVVNGATNWNFRNFEFSVTNDPNTIFVEFEGSADVIATGKPYHQLYIGRITLKDGKISSYREFWNPIWIMDAFM